MPVVQSPNLMIGFEPAGSACGVWRDGLSSYVLSAAHVLDNLPVATPIGWLSANPFESGSGATLDPSMVWLPVEGGRLDAALVRIENLGPFRIGGPFPTGFRVLPAATLSPGLVVTICGKHGLEPARFRDILPAGDEFNGRRHGRLLRFEFETDSMTDPGDSGAAILTEPEGMLVGMHIALRTNGGRFSLAVPADDVRDTFGLFLPGFTLRP